MNQHWRALRPLIIEALERDGDHSIETVERAIIEGRAHLWLSPKAAFVTEFEDYPNSRVLRVWLGVGEMDELLKMQPALEAWAVTQGCTKACILTRPGWARVLQKTGFRQTHVALTKDLTR